MAENKKSFILYTDFITTFEELSDEEAGKLIKHIFRYTNDQKPETEDRLIKLVFEPIKQQLKRDLESWNGTRVERSKSGHLGGIKSGEVRREAKKNKEIEANEANASNSEANEANEAVNVNVTVNVNDNDIIKSKILPLPYQSTEFKETWNILKNEKKWKRKSPAALDLSLKQLAKYPEQDAIQMMKNTIAGNWQGLFEIKINKNAINNNATTKRTGKSAGAYALADELLADYKKLADG